MFEKLDEFIEENDDEMMATGSWGDDNGEVYPEADDFESFLLAQLQDGKENW